MEVPKYFWEKRSKHFNDLNILFNSHKIQGYEHIMRLPELGLIIGIPGTTTPVAAGYFRKLENSPGIVMLDSLITNADLSPEMRDKGLDFLVTKLIELAKKYDITSILAFTTDKNTLMRATRFGFAQLEHQVISLPLL